MTAALIALSSRCRATSLSWILRLLLAALTFGAHLHAQAQTPLILSPALSGKIANTHAELLADPSGTLTLSDILRPEIQQRFSPANGKSGAGMTETAWWIKLTLEAPLKLNDAWWLEVHPLNLFDLRVYLPDGQGGTVERLSGERVAYAAGRDLDYRQFAFALPLRAGETSTIYLRAYDPGGTVFPITLWQEKDLEHHIHLTQLLLGMVYGLLLGLSIYNLFLAVTLRDMAYIWYVASTLSVTLFIAHLYGHTAQHLWPEWPWMVAAGRVVIPGLWGAFLALFVISFFQVKTYLPLAWRLLQLTFWLYVGMVVMRILGAHALPAWLITHVSFLAVPLALLVPVIRWRQGFRPAGYFLLGYGVLLISTSIFILRVEGIIDPSRLTEFSLPAAAAFEALVFSLALADRINALRQAGTRAFIDELTGAGNRRMLDLRFEEARYQADRNNRMIGIVAIDLDNFKPINDTHGHAAGDVVLQAISRRLQGCLRSNDCLTRIGGDEFVLLLTDLDDAAASDEILHRIQAVCRQPISHTGLMLNVTPSIGVALYPQDGKTLASLNRCADTALYTAKREGRDRLCHYQTPALV